MFYAQYDVQTNLGVERDNIKALAHIVHINEGYCFPLVCSLQYTNLSYVGGFNIHALHLGFQ